MSATARPVAPGDTSGLVALFDAAGSDCFCRYWHFHGDKNAWLARCAFERDVNRDELADAVASQTDEGRGVVALVGDTIVGWAKVAPSVGLTKLYTERYYRSLVSAERPRVWTVACFLVHPERRRQGVAHALVGAAVSLARSEGAAILEAFPRKVDGEVADEELWRGPEGALAAWGFAASAGDATYPVMRLSIASE